MTADGSSYEYFAEFSHKKRQYPPKPIHNATQRCRVEECHGGAQNPMEHFLVEKAGRHHGSERYNEWWREDHCRWNMDSNVKKFLSIYRRSSAVAARCLHQNATARTSTAKLWPDEESFVNKEWSNCGQKLTKVQTYIFLQNGRQCHFTENVARVSRFPTFCCSLTELFWWQYFASFFSIDAWQRRRNCHEITEQDLLSCTLDNNLFTL